MDQEPYAVAIQNQLGNRDDVLNLSVLCMWVSTTHCTIHSLVPQALPSPFRDIDLSHSLFKPMVSDMRVNHHMCIIIGPLHPTCWYWNASWQGTYASRPSGALIAYSTSAHWTPAKKRIFSPNHVAKLDICAINSFGMFHFSCHLISTSATISLSSTFWTDFKLIFFTAINGESSFELTLLKHTPSCYV